MSDTGSPRRGRDVSLHDLFGQLLWPKLLRAPALGLRPDRIGIAFFSLVLIGVIGSVSGLWTPEGETAFPGGLFDQATDAYGGIVESVIDADPDQFAGGLERLMALPGQAFELYPWSMFVLGLPMLIVWSIGACAISRMVACEFSQGVDLPWTSALGFSLGRVGSSVGGLLLPIVLIAVIVFGLMVAGWALLSLPGLNIVGGIAYVLFQIAGVLAVLLLLGYAIGKHLIIPAVACDGADGIDAMQRAYAYVVARPLRLLIYLSIGAVLTLVVYFIVKKSVLMGLDLTDTATSHWMPETAASKVHGDEAPGGTWNASWGLVSLWKSIFRLLILAVAMSVYTSVSTIVYLLIRQVCDGQDHRELWTPGTLGGTQASATSDG